MKKKKGKVCNVTGKRVIFFSTILMIVLLNYVTSVITDVLKIPFFLDTWATMLGVMTAGLAAGVAGGFLYNIVMAFTQWGLEAWIWSLSSIWVAVISLLLWKKGWINLGNPVKIVGAGIIIAITNSILTIMISYFAFGNLPTYAGTEPTYQAFYALTKSAFLASIGEHTITELADKTVSVFMAGFFLEHLPKECRINLRRKKK